MPSEPQEMVTFSRADGEDMGEYRWSVDIETCELDAEYGEPSEYLEQRWVLVSERRFWLPICSDAACEEKATYWGLCEAHAREDDPDAFTDGAPHA